MLLLPIQWSVCIKVICVAEFSAFCVLLSTRTGLRIFRTYSSGCFRNPHFGYYHRIRGRLIIVTVLQSLQGSKW